MDEPLSKLDALIRRAILRHPLIFGTRWDVLRHLYLVIGNGYEWEAGELVDVFADETTDEQARANFFSDLDDMRDKFADYGGFDDQLARRRRQFILDNLDLLVHERRIDTGIRVGWEDVIQISLEYSAAFNVPDDAEASFKAGAVEVLGELIPGLAYVEGAGQDRGVRAAAIRERERLAPTDHAAMVELMAKLRPMIDAELNPPA